MNRVAGAAALRRPRLVRATGALTGQVSLALGSLMLQVVAARALGAEGLGHFALLFGYVVMATAVSTGLVGDSLTVLDRHSPALRSALLTAAVATIAVASTAAFILTAGRLGPVAAALFALATAAFMAADLLRRTLMACLRFWSLVAVDGLALVAASATLLIASSTGPLTLAHVVAALAVGQLTACVVAIRCLPVEERRLARLGTVALPSVFRFGGWRALQQFVRPTTLNAARWVVLLAAGHAAVGELEAARVFVAPAMLLVQGVASYLFASYAADRDQPVPVLLRRADRAAVTMLAGCSLMAVAAAVTAPLLGPILTGGRFDLSVLAVLGWGAYAASCAAVLPYGSLAAVRGAPARVLALRVVDSTVAVLATALAVLAMGMPFSWVPWVLSAGSFLGGYLCRTLLLTPMASGAGVPAQSEPLTPAVSP
jgi:O-antigen/teichoic acid export membrane protein